MEDEQGNLPSETTVENMDIQNQVEESYEEGDGGEIMVEIVGSDVFVDGVSGQKEGDFGGGEVGDLEGQVWENREESKAEDSSEAMDVSGGGDGNRMGESESGLSESRDEKNWIGESESGLSESRDERNRMGESDSGLSESRDQRNRMGESESGLSESRDEKNRMEESESGFSASRDEKNDGVTEEVDIHVIKSVDVEGHSLENREESQAQYFSEAMDVLGEGDGNRMGETESGLSESRDEKNYVVTEEVGNHLTESVDAEGHASENREESQAQDISEAMDVSGEGDGNQKEESEPGFSEPRDGKNCPVTEEVDVHLTESVDVKGDGVGALSSRGVGVLDDEAWNPGIEATVVSSSAATMQTEEFSVTTVVLINEEKTDINEAVNNDSADLGTPEPDHTVEAVLDRKTGIIEKEEVLPSSDDAPSRAADSLTVHGSTEEVDGDQTAPSELSLKPNCGGPKNVDVDWSVSVVGEVGLVNASAEGELSDSGMPKDGIIRGKAENATTGGDCVIEAKILDEKEVLAAESKDSVLKADAVSHASAESIYEKSVVSGRGEAIGEEFNNVLDSKGGASNVDPLLNSKDGASNINTPDISLGNDGCLETNMVHQNHVFSNEPPHLADKSNTVLVNEDKGLVVEIQAKPDENQSNTMTATFPEDEQTVQADSGMYANQPVTATIVGEVIDDQKVAFSQIEVVDGGGSSEKDGVPSISPPDISLDNDGCFKTDGGLETNMVHQNHVFSNEPPHPANESDTVVVNKDKGLNVEIQADTEENQPNTTNSTFPEDEQTVQAESHMYVNQPIIATTDNQKVAISQMEVVDGGGSSEKGERIDSEISNQSLECQVSAETPALDASTENMQLPEKGVCSKVETADVMAIEDHVLCNDPVIDTDAGFENVVEECGSPQHKEEEAHVQTTETPSLVEYSVPVVNTEAGFGNVVEECGSPQVQHKEEEVPAEITETSNHVVYNDPVVDTEVGFDNVVEECGSPQHKEEEVHVVYSDPVVDTEVGFDNVVEEFGSPQHKEEEVPAQIAETSSHVMYSDPVVNTEIGFDNVVEEFGSPQHNEEEVSVQITETSSDVVYNDPVVYNEAGFDNVVEEFGSPQHKEEEIPEQITETSSHMVDMLDSINLIPNEVAEVATISDITQVSILPGTTEKAELHVCISTLLDGGDIEENVTCDVATSIDEVNKPSEADVNSSKSNGFYTVEGHTSETKLMDVDEERASDRTYHEGEGVESEFGTEETASVTEKLKFSNEQSVKSASPLRMNLSGYLLPPENEGIFALSDLVWGKVRSHPWWPGQIFDPADASEKAVKYHKKDSYLVAYFGDRTFAWNDSSLLKPLRSHFSHIEKQSNSESFQNAVNCALEEVSRRVELGLACSCTPKDAYLKIETQVVENTGIREESNRRYGVDQSSRACCFEPDKLLDYVRDLAPHASSGADRLDIVIARAQLSAFCHFKGYRAPMEFPPSGELLEIDADAEHISEEMAGSDKHKHTPRDSLQSRKERSLTELMGGSEYSPDAEDESGADDLGKSVSSPSGRKRKALDPLTDGSDKRASVYAAKVSTSVSQTPKPSFKIGECIRRVASQLTGSTSSVKGNSDETIIGGSPKIYEHSEKRNVVVSVESSSLDEMLSQLHLLAQDPKKGHNFPNSIHTFFMGFRSSIAIALLRRGRKKRTELTSGVSAEEFEFDDVNDSYWTDRIVHNYSEEQLLNNSENGAGNHQLVSFGTEKSPKPGRKPHSRKRFSTGSYPTAAPEVDENIKRRKQESSPAELILNFADRKYLPSEINLNKMFRRFGPLMESETEVDHEAGSAKVIFKRGSDAEVARNSSEKFNIFGPVLVNYQIGYSPLISVKIMPVAIPQYHEDPELML